MFNNNCMRIAEVNDFLMLHYGFSLKKKTYGKGTFSLVYSIDRKRVVKLSTDPYWYLLMKHLHAKKCKHVPEFLVDYGVIEHVSVGVIGPTPVYAVEMPKYAFPKEDTTAYRTQCFLEEGRDGYLSDSILSTKNHIKHFCKQSENALRALAKKEGLNSWITELRIELAMDFHEMNIMEDKQNNLIILDPIFCRSLFYKVRY